MLFDHLEKLKIFRAAAVAKSFLVASRQLRISQPAVTKSIRILEDQLGVKLFLRNSRGVVLTDAGEILYQYSEQIALKSRDIEAQVINLGDASGIIKIATYETLGESLWPSFLKVCRTEFPKLKIELTTEQNGQWLALENGAVDLIVDAEPIIKEKFYSQVLYTDSFSVYAHAKSKLKLTGMKHPLPTAVVPYATDKHGVSVLESIRRYPKDFDTCFQLQTFTMVRSLLLEDVCVGVLPERLAAPLLKANKIKVVSTITQFNKFGHHRICATILEDRKSEKRLIEILKSLKRHCKDLSV